MSAAAGKTIGNAAAPVRIVTPRFVLRTLEAADASATYLNWFSDPVVRRFIVAAGEPQSLCTIRSFIAAKRASPTAELFGIFVKDSGLHIGNIKFEPIDEDSHRAIIGVMIGNPAWRGVGAFREAYASAAKWLLDNRGIREFWLGVAPENTSALKSYRAAGFTDDNPPARLGIAGSDAIFLKHVVANGDG